MSKMLGKYTGLFGAGGLIYVVMELMWRGRSHWSMFLLGGICFIALGLINKVIPWETPLWQQAVLGSGIITLLEFVTGMIVNRRFGWQVWDYSHMPGNILGQICPQFTLLWIPISIVGIILDDYLRWRFFGEEKPHYKLF